MPNNPLYNQLLERVISERPDMAPYAELFQQLLSNNDEAGESEIRVKELENRLRKITSIAKRLKEDLDDTLDELDNFAKALGACNICWGEDNRCLTCRGKGQSGFYQPDRKMFDRLILPALRAVPWLEITEVK